MIQVRSHHAIVGALTMVTTLTAGCGSSPAETSSDALTYHRDVKPIVDASCGGCHREGGIAPFALTTYAEVSAHKAAIKAATAARTMPPWPPAKDCTDYESDRSLSDEEIATIGAWVEEGAPEGDPKDAPAPQASDGPTLSRVDRTLALPEPYTPTLSPDEYRCFLLDWPEQETTYITGLGVEPGAASIVHHVIVFRAAPDAVAKYQALDDAEPGPGYTCFGGPGGTNDATSARAGWVGGWVPGGFGRDFPAGTGIEMLPGSKLVVQLHYNMSTAPATPDQTKIALKLDSSVEKKASVIPYTNPEWVTSHTMDIPAHAMDATHAYSADPSPLMAILSSGAVASGQPFTIHEAGLHLHTRGTRALTRIERAGGGDECVLDIPRWNFHWQGGYRLAQPKTFNPGDKLTLECHWNNPAATDLNWGEGTGDEMCLGIFYVTQ